MDGSRVLVIDDSTTLRKLVEIAMRGTGCRVDFAANGSDGVSCARANRPDVILLDYLLPDLRSAEVCQRLRDNTTTSSVPVVIMSANAPSVLDDFREFSTVVGFIGKPFTPAEIRSRLEGVVERGGMARRPARASEAAIASGSTVEDLAPAHGLQLRGDLAATPLLEVLRLVAASRGTGALVVEPADDGIAPARIWLRRGDLVMCAGASAASLSGVPGELRERVIRNLALGKPALVTLAEAGAARAANLPLELHAASARLIGELVATRSGRFAWQPAAALPDFVEAFGRNVSLTATALERARRTTGSPALGALEQVFDRTARFSDKLPGAQLLPDEQRVLAVLDGRTTGREVAARAGLSTERGAAILTQLVAADLIELAVRGTARRLAVLDPSGELAHALRARFDVIVLEPGRSLLGALEARPAVALVGAAALDEHVLRHQLPIVVRNSAIAVVGVLDAPDPARAATLLGAGLHAVIAKPLHATELERLLSG